LDPYIKTVAWLEVEEKGANALLEEAKKRDCSVFLYIYYHMQARIPGKRHAICTDEFKWKMFWEEYDGLQESIVFFKKVVEWGTANMILLDDLELREQINEEA
jgi:hypothetical protein